MRPYRIISDEEYELKKKIDAEREERLNPKPNKPNLASRAKKIYGKIEEDDIKKEETSSNKADSMIIPSKNIPILDILNKGDLTIGGYIPSEPVVSKPKRTRKKKDESEDIIYADSDRKLSDTESNEPYYKKYEETNNVLKGAIIQLNQGIEDMDMDINYIRSSKTLKRKYDYLSLLQGTKGNYIANKISAARELNNTITKCNELELKRIKELHLADKVDDDKAILDTYNAFISTPVGTNYSPLGPTSSQLTIRGDGNIIPAIITSNTADSGYNNYINNPTSIQHMMQLESNPNVKQVVVYNQATGAKSFEIMDMSTGEILQNVEKNDIMFLEDTTIDVRNGIAKNINLNETYPLIVVGNRNFDEY